MVVTIRTPRCGAINPGLQYYTPLRRLPQNTQVIDQMSMFCRFEKNDILRVVRALAIFRPSLIALQMPITEQDEIFVERALQRSLLVSHTASSPLLWTEHRLASQELEKLMSYSGTPTAIWRRTGEICVVGLEFTMLTGWTKEDLIGRRRFIYEVCTIIDPLCSVTPTIIDC